MVSIGERVWTEHLVFIGGDKSNKRVTNDEEPCILLELSCQLFKVRSFWGLVNVPGRRNFRLHIELIGEDI